MQLGEASVLQGQLQRRRPVDVLAERLQRAGAHESDDLGSQGTDRPAVGSMKSVVKVVVSFQRGGVGGRRPSSYIPWSICASYYLVKVPSMDWARPSCARADEIWKKYHRL
jgi:hypothetical protein